MFRIMTFNANGIRSAAKKGFFDWFDGMQADVLCVQELKAQEQDLGPEFLKRAGYVCYVHTAFGLVLVTRSLMLKVVMWKQILVPLP